MNTSEKIIIVVVAIVAIVVIVYFGFLKNENKFVYYTVKGSTSTRELIENYKDFDKLAKEAKLKDEITNAIDFSKSELLDTFNEEYFTNKKVAVISAYEDTSRAYMYSIDKLEYNSDSSNYLLYRQSWRIHGNSKKFMVQLYVG